MKKDKTKVDLHIRPRLSESIMLEIPQDTLESLKQVAAKYDMSYQALLKFYIGQGLRQDLANSFEDKKSHPLLSEETYEEILADEALWEAQFAATDDDKLAELVAAVEVEINEGDTLMRHPEI